MTARDTRERILDAGERLFAERGVEAVSLRDVTRLAGVNLAGVHYHFGSKLALVRAVFERRLGPINEKRLALLDACEATAGRSGPALKAVLYAFLAPALETLRGNPWFTMLGGRIHAESDPRLVGDFLRQFDRVLARFLPAFRRALPGCRLEDLFWALQFVVGAMIQTACGGPLLEQFSGGRCRASDPRVVERLVAFCAAGLGAPAGRKR
jgi:AcrR family transcriptional regulator